MADVQEGRHRRAGHADYQFRLGSTVVDATRAGGLARFINHSCGPNCLALTCVVDGRPHLGIFAGRDIAAGEELCYDYQVCRTPCRRAQWRRRLPELMGLCAHACLLRSPLATHLNCGGA